LQAPDGHQSGHDDCDGDDDDDDDDDGDGDDDDDQEDETIAMCHKTGKSSPYFNKPSILG
jgi:hypothetical protein